MFMNQAFRNNPKRILSLLLILVMVFTAMPQALAETSIAVSQSEIEESKSLPNNIRDGVILHAFDWNLDVIEENLQAIADAGYTAIQTSPVMGVADGENWYYAYQPRNMIAGGNGNRYGDRDALVSLTTAAESYGIKIVVDVVPNHMGSTSNTDAPWNDSTYFHNVSSSVGYNDRFLLTQPNMISGLRDLDTHSSFVQESFISYLKDLIDAGASGFRYDAIKHIELDDDQPSSASIAAGATNAKYADGEFKSDYVKNVTGAVKAYFEEKGKNSFQYGEVLQGGDPNNDRMAGYAQYIDLTASRYGHDVRSVLEVGDVGRLDKWADYAAEGLAAEQLVPWVESHDTYNNEGESLGFSPKQIRQGWAMVAARKGASPLFFARNVDANGNQITSVRTANNVNNSRSQWSHPEVVAINKFHNAMAGKDENLVSLGNNAVMIERGTAEDGGGAVLLNTSTTDRVLGSVPVNYLKDGYYVNALNPSNVFTVVDGKISGTIPGNPSKISNTDTNDNAGLVVLMAREDATPAILAALPANDDVGAGNSFTSSQLQLSLSAVNVKNAMYAINNGDAIAFENNEMITVDADYNGPITITLVGQTDAGNWITKHFTYTWVEAEGEVAPPVEEPTHVNVYFSINRNASFQAWSSNSIGVYSFNPELFGGWPGGTLTRMKYNDADTHWYTIVMPRTAVGGIIFNNKTGQQTGQPAITASMLNNEQLYFYGTGASGFGINNGATWETAFAEGNNIGYEASNVFPPGRNGIIFNTSGGSTIDNQYVRDGEKATRPVTNPTRDGYLFDGKWYTDLDFENEYDFETPVVNTLGEEYIYALTLYAGWIELEDDKYLVEFDSHGGSLIMTIPNVVGGTLVSEPDQPERNGYTFVGWYKDSNGEQEWNFESDAVTESIKLHAKWQLDAYNIEYLNGSEPEDMPENTPYSYSIETETFTLPSPNPKEGYSFAGWYTDPQFIPSSKLTSISQSSYGDLTLFARYTANNYSIVLDSLEGLGGTTSIDVSYGSKLPLAIHAPVKSGYEFQGYFAEVNGQGDQYYNSDGIREFIGEWSNLSGSTFYAYWTPIGGEEENVLVEAITINGGSSITSKGGKLQLTAEVSPENATNKAVAWSLENGSGKATINATGLVTAVSNGTVTVIATAADGSGIEGKKIITISGQTVSNPEPSTPTPTEPVPTSPTPTLPAPSDVIKDGDKAIVELASDITSQSIAVQELAGLTLQVKAGQTQLTVPADVLQQWLTTAGNPAEASLEVTLAPVATGELGNTSAAAGGARVNIAGEVYNITLQLKHSGGTIDLATASSGVELTLPYGNDADAELLGIYYYNEESKQWEYVGGQVDEAKQTVTVTLQHLSTYGVLEYAKSFTDVPANHWAHRTLEVLAAKHIVNGTSDTHFTPNGATTRAEFTSLLVRALGLTDTASAVPFTDVQAGQWYAKEVAAAYEAGLVSGVTADKFEPNAKITREQMAVLLVRAMEYKNRKISYTGQETSSLKDQASISTWAQESVNKALAAGLLQGKGNGSFDPSAEATRAETAQVILNLLNKR